MNDLILIQKDDLRTLLEEVVEEKLIVLKQWFESLNLQNERPLTKKEAWEYLGVSRSTFGRYEEKGLIPKHSLGYKDYYKRNELDEAMIQINTRTTQKLVS